MTLLKHELRQGRLSLAVWTGSIASLLVLCVFLFPEMKGEMDGVGALFSSMGSFSAAFGMDRLNFGTLTGYYAIECGNVLGLGGAFFASLLGISALAKEERGATAEFLLTHPVSRARVVTEKLVAVTLQLAAMNLTILGLSSLSIGFIGEEIVWKELLLLHLAYFLLQLELAGICLGISAFLHRGGLGIGLGLAAMLYFLSLISNITEGAEFFKYITPFGYCEGADILTSGGLDGALVALGMLYALLGIAAAYGKYCTKDLQ